MKASAAPMLLDDSMVPLDGVDRRCYNKVPMKKQRAFLLLWACLLWMAALGGCASTSPRVRKLTKPVDQTAEELVKVREIQSGGETRAILSPADSRQVKIKF